MEVMEGVEAMEEIEEDLNLFFKNLSKLFHKELQN
jgi:hypothetical protein